ncbi:uncharacterized protein LOC135585901 isoform X1 [Musa acuminata AAA Group]|uniref:uncharacterized protein LOC135585901 isoform X1 n=1 Tax=Musa acuminata AAA Group TaxID=214697 RepID=UPI0031E446A7
MGDEFTWNVAFGAPFTPTAIATRCGDSYRPLTLRFPSEVFEPLLSSLSLALSDPKTPRECSDLLPRSRRAAQSSVLVLASYSSCFSADVAFPFLTEPSRHRCCGFYVKGRTLGSQHFARRMYQSRRSRRREEPLDAAERSRSRNWASPARAGGQHFHIRRRPNASRGAFDSVDSACNIGFSAEENSFTLEIRQSSSKKASQIPIREMMVSNEKEIKRPSPNLIARLMGLDSLPSPVRQQKNMDCYCQTSSSIGFLENHVHPEDHSYQRSAIEDQEFKDVFEVTETSKKKKHKNYSNNGGMLSHRGNKIDMDLIRQKSMVIERFSTHEMLQNSRKFNDAVKVPDQSKDLFLELLQDPNSLFAKHLRDLNRSPPSPDQSKITNLRLSKGTKHSRNEVWCKFRSERNPDRCFPMSQEVMGSCTMHMTRLNKHYVEENNGFLSHNLTASHVGKTEVDVHPAHIVILKPNLEKSQKMAEANYFPQESFRFCSKRCREIAASGTDELHDNESRQRFHHTQVFCHKIKGSREIPKEIRRKLRHTISHTNKGSTSEMNPYAGNMDSCSFPGFCSLYHSEAISQSPGHFGECCSSISPSLSYSTESSVSREARRRLCERWKLTHEFQNMRLIPHGSSTLGEILSLSDREVPKVTMEMLDTKKVSEENLANNEVLGNKDCPLGISSYSGCTDGSSRYLPRLKSLPVSCSPELTDRKQNEGNRKPMIKDVRDMKPSVSSDASFTKPGKPPLKPSKHQTHKYMQTYSIGEENMLPEWEIHANSEGSRKSIHLRHFVDKRTLHPSPTDYGISDRSQLISNASIPILRDEPWHLTAQEEQTMQSAYQESLENEGSYGHIKNVIVIEGTSSDHLQVKLLPSESGVAESHPLSSKKLVEQPSPVSVLETPSEDKTYSSECFERLTADLKELRMQLQLLKLESVTACSEETDVLMLSEEDSASDSHKRLPSREVHQRFIDDDDRDFTYLLDMLIESGIHGVDDKKLVGACYLLGYPVDQNIFSKIEKKYEKIASWSRSERKFLFDLINCTLAGLVTSCMDAHPRVTSKICQPSWVGAGLVEGLWQMVAKQKEVDCNRENKILEPGWFCLEYDIGLIVTEMESLLNDDLLEELVSEFVSVRATPELLW